jgi:hypothetical protein
LVVGLDEGWLEMSWLQGELLLQRWLALLKTVGCHQPGAISHSPQRILVT